MELFGNNEQAGKHITSGVERYIYADNDEDKKLEGNLVSQYGLQSMFVMGEEDGQIYEMYEPVRQKTDVVENSWWEASPGRSDDKQKRNKAIASQTTRRAAFSMSKPRVKAGSKPKFKTHQRGTMEVRELQNNLGVALNDSFNTDDSLREDLNLAANYNVNSADQDQLRALLLQMEDPKSNLMAPGSDMEARKKLKTLMNLCQNKHEAQYNEQQDLFHGIKQQEQ